MLQELKITINEELLADLGQEQVQRAVVETLEKLQLKKHLPEMLADLKAIDVQDKDWKKAREKAWNEYEPHFNRLKQA